MRYVAALIALALVAGGLLVYSKWRTPPQTVSGFVEAYEIRVGSLVGGRIEKVLVEEGDRVTAGQPLAQLAPFDLQEREAEAEATLSARKAELKRLEQGFRAEEIDEAKARHDQLQARLDKLQAGARAQEREITRAQVDAAEAGLALATKQFERTQDVFRRGQATSEEMDIAAQRLRDAKAQAEIRRQELSLIQEGTRKEEIQEAKAQLAEAKEVWQLRTNGFRKEEIEQARAAVDAAAAALGTIRQQIKELTIRAEVPGIVEALNLRPGDLVPPRAPVLSIMDTSELWIRAYVPESRADMQVGQPVVVTLDAFPNRRFKGEVTFVSREAEFTPRNVQTVEERSKQVFRIKVTLLDGRELLRPGMIGDVWLKGK